MVTRAILGLAIAALVPIQALAQSITFDGPTTGSSVNSCDDFATIDLGDPWDMSNTADIPYFTRFDQGYLANPGFSSGVFSFTTAAANLAYFYLFAPEINGAYRIAGINNTRWGQDLNIDTSKYSYLNLRMYTDMKEGGGIKLIWNRDRSYVANSSVSSVISNVIGWHVYRINLDTLSLSTSESSNTNPWSAGSVTGFSIQPNQANGAAVQIDWIRLEDPDSCGSYTLSFTANSGSSGNRYSIYLDTDANPFNGFIKQIASSQSAAAADTRAFDTLGVAPGSYYVNGFVDGDYASLERTNPWDFSDNTDLDPRNFNVSAAISGGLYQGTTANAEPALYMPMTSSGLNASTYYLLTFKLSTSSGDNPVLFWNKPGGGLAALVVTKAIYDADNDGEYRVNLSSSADWAGTITDFILRPATSANSTFALDYLSISSSNYGSPRDSSLDVTTGPATLRVNQAPVATLFKPDPRGGEQLRPWNMNPDDFVLFGNLRGDTDEVYTSEPYTAYLPDVRTVYSERGDFFKGTNKRGNDDPSNHSTFNSNPLAFEASGYPNLCFKLAVDAVSESCHVPVVRVIWNQSYTSDDLVAIHDRWSTNRWYEYCTDMRTMRLEGSSDYAWNGTITSFRVDPHEYSNDTCDDGGNPIGNEVSTTYYFDHIKLRKDFNSRTGKIPIVYSLADSDNSSAEVRIYRSSAKGTLGDLIATVSGTTSLGLYEWDTTAVPNGTYYLNTVSSDGSNSTTRFGKHPVVVANDGITAAAPLISLESPEEGQTVCDTLQVKGYALMNDRFEGAAAVQTLVDSSLIGTTLPSQFSDAARTAYPSYDSSDSGFNVAYDSSALSSGTHTVTIRAWGPDGGTTDLTRTITKANTNCPALKSDPDPSGTPISVSLEDPNEDLPAPALSKVKYKKNVLSFTVSNSGDSACDTTIRAGKSAKDLADVKSFSGSNDTSSLKFSAKGLKINSKKLPKFVLEAKRSCDGMEDASSKRKKVSAGKNKGRVKTSAALRKALAAKLRQQ